MTLRQKQSKFAHMLALLILHAEQLGYEVTLARGFDESDTGIDNSLHKIRLAQDINLFKAGRYLRKTSDHLPLGLYWESIGGSWGGRFKDGNHYSLEHRGVR